jgi:hypothetical protein
MSNFKNNIDRLVSKVLNEEIENKVKQITEEMGEWTEIEVDEELHGGQKKLDVAEPKGKITGADFKKLRGKKEETKEFHFPLDAESTPGDYEGDEDEEEEAEELSNQEPTYVGRGLDDNKTSKMFGSFDDEHGWYDENERQFTGDFDFDYDEEEFDDFDSYMTKFGDRQRFFSPGESGKKFFDIYRQKYGPMKIRLRKDMEEAETEEGNAFSGALAKAKESGKDSFEVDGKKYNVKESKKNSLRLTEDELIDLIEQIVLEQKVTDVAEKDNFKKNSPEGLKKTEKVLGQNKKENEDYAKEVVKKMKDYMKDMVSGGNGYDENPDDFPQSNYDMEKEHNEKKYHPSDAVEEYIEAFAYPGMTNLVYDEIKPDDEMIEKQIKGDSKNGNAVTGKDGKALGNVSKRSEKVGERFKKNFDDNLYGAEQMNVSYKRQSQPVDVAGENRQSGGLKKGSTAKAQKIMNQLESKEDKKSKIISEEMEKMKNLIGYNRKTQ